MRYVHIVHPLPALKSVHIRTAHYAHLGLQLFGTLIVYTKNQWGDRLEESCDRMKGYKTPFRKGRGNIP